MDQTTWNGYCTLRSLMRAYHQARASKKFERGRLNRGLGIAMRKQTVALSELHGSIHSFSTPGHAVAEQKFTFRTCTCVDHRNPLAPLYCKHQIASMLLVRAMELDAAEKKNAAASVQLPLPVSDAAYYSTGL